MKTMSIISSYKFLLTYNARYRHFVTSLLRSIYQYVIDTKLL